MSELQTHQLANEILKLEGVHQTAGELNDEQLHRWRELVCMLLMKICPKSEKRKDLRIPADMKTSVRKGDQLSDAVIVDLHKTGVAVEGTFDGVEIGDEISFESFQEGESTHYTKVPAIVRRKEAVEGGKTSLGLELLDDGTNAKKRFFDVAFYPAYLEYLKGLTSST